jgi:hypothetical protein
MKMDVIVVNEAMGHARAHFRGNAARRNGKNVWGRSILAFDFNAMGDRATQKIPSLPHGFMQRSIISAAFQPLP